MSILLINPHLIATPIVKIHHGRNLHPCNLVVTDKIVVFNHAEVKQLRHERVKKWSVMVKIVVYDGREKKSFCLTIKRRSNTIACHSPSSTPPFFSRKFLNFTAKI